MIFRGERNLPIRCRSLAGFSEHRMTRRKKMPLKRLSGRCPEKRGFIPASKETVAVRGVAKNGPRAR
jgi:hypothetical protein